MRLPEGWTTETVDADGVDLQCYRTGDGPPVVLLHGLYDHGRRWVPLAEELAGDYEVIAYDARGHGRSDAPEDGYAVEDRVADLAAVVAGTTDEDPVLVGHSMGGATAAWAGATRPDLPRALALVDPEGLLDEPPIGPDERAAAVRERLDAAADQSIDELVAEHYPDQPPDHARRLARAAHECSPRIAEIAREGYPSPLVEVFPDVECPALVVRSDTDVDRRVGDLDAADELVNGRLVHVHGAGHYVFRDEFDAALAELRAFLRRV